MMSAYLLNDPILRADLISVLVSRHDGAIYLLLPAALPAAGKGTFCFPGAEMPDFLPFGFGCPMMIIAGLDVRTSLMRRSHIDWFIQPSEFQRADMFDDPALANAINGLIAQNADSAGTLPDRQALA